MIRWRRSSRHEAALQLLMTMTRIDRLTAAKRLVEIGGGLAFIGLYFHGNQAHPTRHHRQRSQYCGDCRPNCPDPCPSFDE